MCGIAGIFSTTGPENRKLLETMGTTLSHRGPDDIGIYQAGNVGLVHTRLSIIDLSGGHQPLAANDGKLQLIANGEIYNYIELRAELEQRGHSFSTHSDCEVILHAYREYGENFLDYIFGMFAFALYDQEQQQLILVRDRLGIKPLFIAHTPNGLAFASEIKALLPAFPNPPDINPEGLAQYLQNQFSSGRTTIYKSIERLLPGEIAYLRAGAINKRYHYWSANNIAPARIVGPEAAYEQFSELMAVVMQQHMRSDVPFGLFLSGGLDSSLLLALLSKYSNEPIRTFSVGFPDSSVGSELSAAEQLAQHYHSQHTVITPDADDMFQRLPFCTWAADDLMRDNANLPTALLAEQAASELKVVFTGEGNDEIFAGYGRYRPGRIESLLKSIVYPGSGGFRTSGTFSSTHISNLFGPELRQAAKTSRKPFIEAWQSSHPDWSALQRRQYTDIQTALPDNLLPKVDRMLMGWGIEGRVPFLDHRVVEFGLALPDPMKIANHQGKVFIRRWAESLLPHDTIWRKKRGFHVPIGDWMRGEILNRMEQVLPKHSAINTWFDPTAVTQLIKQQRQGNSSSRRLMTLLQFAIWHQIFIQNKGERPPTLVDPVDWLANT